VKKAAAPAKPVKKEKVPTKTKRGPNMYEFADYKNETIVIEGDEVKPSSTFNFFNCERTKVIVKGKFKNICLSRCKRVNFEVDSCLSMIEVLKSDTCKVKVNGKIPMMSIEHCQEFGITCNTKESKDGLTLNVTCS